METEQIYALFRDSTGISTDTRTLRGGELFVALKGERHDGSRFALKALELGAKYALVEAGSEAAASGNPSVFAVEDTLAALTRLARRHRESLRAGGRRLPVIALTGTNGKTTTKELISAVLSKKFRVCATSGNLNNDIGVPLSLLRIPEGTEIAVIEMGASHPDDIEKLVRVAEPDYGLLTNVGRAHLLGFGSMEGVCRAKGALYDYLIRRGGTIFYNADDRLLTAMLRERGAVVPEGMTSGKGLPAGEEPTQGQSGGRAAAVPEVLPGGETDGAAVPGVSAGEASETVGAAVRTVPYGVDFWKAECLPTDADRPFLRMTLPVSVAGIAGDGEVLVETRLVGDYNAGNVAAAIAVGLHFGVPLPDILEAVWTFVPDNNRSQLVHTGKNTLIVDAYNANPTSMKAAIDNFGRMEGGHKVLLLGSMGELGEASVREHIALLGRLAALPAESLFLVGEEFRKALSAIGCPDSSGDGLPVLSDSGASSAGEGTSATGPSAASVPDVSGFSVSAPSGDGLPVLSGSDASSAGEDTSATGPSGACFCGKWHWYPDSGTLAAALALHPLEGKLILIKGSRSVAMEKTLPAL